MNILHIDTGKEWRGGQSQVLMLARGLTQMQHPSVIVTRKGSALAERARNEGLACEELPLRFEADIASARTLARVADERNSSLVHTHTPHALGLAVVAKRFGMRASILFTRRVSFEIRNRLLNRWKLKQADRIIAVSGAVAQQLIKAGLEPERIRVVHSSVDLNEFSYAGPCLDRPYAIGIAGAVEKAKGIEQAMEFVSKSSRLPVQFHFAGEGPALSALEDRFHNEKIRIHGFVKDVSGFLRKMFSVLSFSPSEGFPNLLLQAMATGLPVVALKNDATSELLGDNQYGYLFDTNKEAFDLLQHLIDDTDRAKAIGAQATEYVQNKFSSHEMVRKTLEVYKEIVS